MQLAPGVQIRAAQPEDLEAVVALCAEHAAFERASFSSEGKTEMIGRALFHAPPRAWCLVAECGIEIVGYAVCSREFSTWMAGEYLHMDCLYVSAKHRGSGLGSRVMTEVTTLARELDCSHIEWQTPARNSDAVRFYDRLGAVSNPKLRYKLTL
jgi:ribosomal protein S18 acetylase RimI-like enzyme